MDAPKKGQLLSSVMCIWLVLGSSSLASAASTLSFDGTYNYGYLPSGIRIYWLTLDSGIKYQLLFNRILAPDFAESTRVTVTGSLTTPSNTEGYAGDIDVATITQWACFQRRPDGSTLPCITGTCGVGGMQCPVPEFADIGLGLVAVFLAFVVYVAVTKARRQAGGSGFAVDASVDVSFR